MYCNNCGKQINDRAKFCESCGNPVTDNKFKTTDSISFDRKDQEIKKKNAVGAILAIMVVLFAVAAIVIAALDSNNTSGSGNDVSGQIGNAETVLEVSPAEIWQDYEDNAVAADAKYGGKLIQITGTIKNIGKDVFDDVYITIDTGEYFGSIQCYFTDNSQIQKVMELKSGESVTIIGRCNGQTINIIMKSCEIQ